MNKFYTILRWLGLVIGLLAVVALAVYILLYSLGIKVDLSNMKFERTGILYLKSYPSNANIKIDNEEQTIKTPVKVRWLLPGEYSLSVCKQGYYCWAKTILIEEGMVDEEKSIRLFYKKPKIKKIGKVDQAVILNGRKSGYLMIDNVIKFFSTSPKKTKGIYRHDSKIRLIEINSHQNRALINNSLVINLLNGNKIINLKKEFPALTDIDFAPGQTNLMIGQLKQGLYTVNLQSGKVKRLWSLSNKNYLITDQGVQAIIKQDKKDVLILKQWNGKIRKIAQTTVKARFHRDKVQFEELKLENLALTRINGQPVIKDNINRYYYLNNKRLEYLGSQITDLAYGAADKSKYLFANENDEIWLVATPERSSQDRWQIVTRLSNAPEQLSFIGYGYLIFQTKGRAHIIDYDGVNSIALKTSTKIKKYWLINDQDIIILTEDNLLKEYRISD